MKSLLPFVVVSLISANVVYADNLEDRVAQLEQRVGVLEQSQLPQTCLTSVDGYVAPGAVIMTLDPSSKIYEPSSWSYEKSFEFQTVKEITDAKGKRLVLVRVNEKSCSVRVLLKSGLIFN